MTEHTVTLKAVLDQTELGDLNSVQSGVQTNFDKNISSVITKLNATLVNLQRSVDKLTQTTQRSSNVAARVQNAAAVPVSKGSTAMPVAMPNVAASAIQQSIYAQMHKVNANLLRGLAETRRQMSGLANERLVERTHRSFVDQMVKEGKLTAQEGFILKNSKNAYTQSIDMVRAKVAEDLRRHEADLKNRIRNNEQKILNIQNARNANALDQRASKDIRNERAFVKAMGLMFGANVLGGLVETAFPQNSGLKRGMDVAQNTLGGAMSGMMVGGPMGALAFGGATLGSSLLVDYMNSQQNLRLREQTANNSIREAKKNFEETMKSLDEFYKSLASQKLDREIAKSSNEWFKLATKRINEAGALNPELLSMRSGVEGKLAKQISNVEGDLYTARNERYNRQLTYNKDIAYLDKAKETYAGITDPVQKAEAMAKLEQRRTELTNAYSKAMMDSNTRIDEATEKLEDLKKQLEDITKYESKLKEEQQKSIAKFVDNQQTAILKENSEKSDREVNLEAYYGGLRSMYEKASNYRDAYESYARELDEYLASDHTAETPQEVAEKTNRLIYNRDRSHQNLQEMWALGVRFRQEQNQELMGDYSNLTRMITSSQNAFSSRGFGFEEGNARNLAVIDIRNIARQIKENTDILKQAGVYQ